MAPLPERLVEALADRYRIEREVGAGGMATVYLATDSRHERKVAIKVLRPELAAMLGSERFLTEIRVTANLQHPHILPLHDSGEAEGFLYYVMPFVEGESLRDRLDRERQLSVEDALRIAAEVADGLSHAHGLGVVHRDIKPANILLTGGHALVADFGIARAVRQAGGARLTETGLSLGTPQYMSPEQASGDTDVDARSDEYALGCVLYEMLAGEAPHTGPNAQVILARVLTQPAPSVTGSRETVPHRVDAAIRKALARLPADRFATVADFADALRGSGSATWDTSSQVTEPTHRPPPRRSISTSFAWSLVAVLGVALAGVLWQARGPAAGIEDVMRMVLDPEPAVDVSIGAARTESGAEVDALAISEDGTRIAFIGRQAGDSTAYLYVRDLADFEARRLEGTESAMSPFFSPDGEWLGFYSWWDGRLKTVPVSGGVPQVVCTCDPILSADWGPDGTIVMDHEGMSGLRTVPALGGDPQFLAVPGDGLEADEHSLSHPRFLPDGRHVLVTAWGGAGATRRIVAIPLDGGERVTLLEEGWAPQHVRSGHLVYLRTNQLWAVPFDAGSLEVLGTPEPVVDSVFGVAFMTTYAVSASGNLVYAPGPPPEPRTSLYVVDRSGQEERLPAPALDWSVLGPRFSPDGDRIVFWGSSGFEGGQGAAQIWVFDPSRESIRAVTDLGPGDFWPKWTPDGRSLVFTSLRGEAAMGIYRVPVDGASPPEALFTDAALAQAGSWLPGGTSLIIQRAVDPESEYDIWLLPLAEDGEPAPLVEGPGNQVHAALSPDGRWLAYASDESGRYEVYVRPYPGLDGARQVSRAGGMGPTWRGDSRELYFYVSGGGDGSVTTFMRTSIDESSGQPEPLWSRAGILAIGWPYGVAYDVTPDGRQFLLPINEQPLPWFIPELHLVFNWLEALEGQFQP
jgi:serine/threonine-protein kinase